MACVGWTGLCHSRATSSRALPQCYARSFQQHPIITGDLFCEVRQNWNIHFAQTATLENRVRFRLVTKCFTGSSFLSCWIPCSWGYSNNKTQPWHLLHERNQMCVVLLAFASFVCFKVVRNILFLWKVKTSFALSILELLILVVKGYQWQQP